jgi:fructose-bisphosphate aldolase class I
MNLQELSSIAVAMVAGNKGLLAADESTSTIKRRFDSIKVESTEDSRRDYREGLFRTPGIGDFISGVILYDETIRQKAADGTPLTKILTDQNVLPGIKVDMGAKPLAGSHGETVTEGLDGLTERVAEYVELGAKFAKWRAVIKIGDGIPSRQCIHVNAHALARYAKICQEGGLVPIVEPEVLMDGAHDINLCAGVTEATLHKVFEEMYAQGVAMEGSILKPNMVISGTDCPTQAGVEEVAGKTIAILRRCCPGAVPGIMFLSGGQSEQMATEHLRVMNANHGRLPWRLSFSYGRALQESALNSWGGKNDNVAAMQQSFLERAKANAAACAGRTLEKAA